MKPKTPHWADQAAARVVATCGDKASYTVASGITPSGTVHIGNFREVITVDLVARALRALGKEVRFIYSWDDFDTLRKVPANLPQQEMLSENLRRSISAVPDPYGAAESYAGHNIQRFEAELVQLGIEPEYLYQHKKYAKGEYADGIRQALEHKEAIAKILNQYRSAPLAEDWLPTAIYCGQCGRDAMDYQRYQGDWQYAYLCASCGFEETVDIRKTENLKLNWRTDWPMRWQYENVDFEPGGKDHSSEGGSYDTAKQIIAEVWGGKAPQYLAYDFVSIKGDAAKMSSSKGNLITLGDALKVYPAQLVRWIFAQHRPNHDFSLAFDQDVIKTFDEFDRAEAAALGPCPDKPGRWPLIRRTYELSCVAELPEAQPYRPAFRELCNRLQIFDGDITKTLERYYQDQVRSEQDLALFQERAACAWRWLTEFAPEEFRYQINSEPLGLELNDLEREAVLKLRAIVEADDFSSLEPAQLNQMVYDDVIRATGIEAKSFFRVVYQLLISRDRGPRLPNFMIELGHSRLLGLLKV